MGIHAPPKSKHLLWRTCRGCLPTRSKLRQHYVPCPNNCQLCEGEVEDNYHIFFDCALISHCWSVAGLEEVIRLKLVSMNEAKLVIHDICSKENKRVTGKVEIMLWVIWNNRNNWIWNNDKKDANQLRMQGYTTYGRIDIWLKYPTIRKEVSVIRQIIYICDSPREVDG
ncbi:unnamed protein product [Vicia faba]|uniref:Reverse transcriptase zinc-binding domain-containing protein n=1 Tax=Vicia faba TaxID=3906 RepID=A0AAV0ZIN0_VICFA|nr:unnamed protein product [Vicia faba]